MLPIRKVMKNKGKIIFLVMQINYDVDENGNLLTSQASFCSEMPFLPHDVNKTAIPLTRSVWILDTTYLFD